MAGGRGASQSPTASFRPPHRLPIVRQQRFSPTTVLPRSRRRWAFDNLSKSWTRKGEKMLYRLVLHPTNLGSWLLRRLMLASLRGVLSVIRCIPPEILSEIFTACRDDDLDKPEYEITTPDYGPTQLTQICSRWRMIALHTPRLWNKVRLLTDAFVDGQQMFIREILDRSCLAPLSITLANPPDWRMIEDGGGDKKRRWLDIVWDSAHRLRHISLDIYSDDAKTQMFPNHNNFPQFENLFPASFPVSQITTLNIDAAFTTFGARDILVQCTALETAKLHNLFDWDSDQLPPSPEICALHHLIQLDVSIGLGTGIAEILDTFTLPKLASLSIASSPSWPDDLDQSVDTLLEISARSRFSLIHLSLVRQDLTLPQLVSLLNILPDLETLVINHCTSVTAPLLEIFTRGAVRPGFIHLHLTVLEIHPPEFVTGELLARAARYLATCTGDPGSAFPSLRVLALV
ncbi:hypothetical protein C8R47DRAFT_1200221 [Mycena vitilis]|nr:hypothetical protein C8R47DRAFT_1200221 [Mycena vitilis]